MHKLQTNKGARYMMIAFIVLFLTMLLRIFYIQAVGVVHNVNVKDLAKEQQNKNGVLEANRGTIYDQNGKVLVQDSTTYRIVVNLKGKDKLKDKEDTAQRLADALEVDKEEIMKNFHEGRTQVEIGKIGRNLSREAKEEINNLKIPGVSFTTEKARVYPNEDFASYILGFARPDDKGNAVGKFGLEESLDKYLRSTNGNVSYVGSRKGIPLTNDIGKVEPAKNGNNVYLTLDKQINSFLEDAMNKAAQHYDPSMLVGIIADPKTGKILAMSSKPSYNPNKGDIEYFLNDPIANAFEPGSTMKVFTLASAINEGVYNGKEYFQSGKYAVGSAEIKDHNGGYGWGSITFDEGFERSSNVAFSILEDQLLKPNKFKQYMNKFGFNQKTGIDLPGESKNTLLLNTQIQQVTTSFGQGSTVTPIQIVQAATAIANDGKMMQPYIVDKVVNPTNKQVIMENQPKEIGNPIKKETAEEVRNLMERVITSSKGTGTMYKIDGYPIGGKTGTAQIPNPENGRYMEGKDNFIFSFLGMAPIDDPQLVVYLAIKQPKLKGNEYGAQPLAEIFKPVMKNSLEYLKVKPYTEKQMADATKQSEIKVQNYVNQTMDTVKNIAEKEKLQPVLLGEGKIIKQYPQTSEVMSEGDRILLVGSNVKMPNLKGWSMRDVMYFSKLLKLDLKTSGMGYVTSQSIEKGQDLQEGDTLELELEPPLQPLVEANTN
ncbi:penicillin binding transpeptidase domain protein [Bacillus mycoides]|uniref:penicillin-binding protein n=1 Tax=Bacillus mycoides TaxID=1405 RepID=UPI0001A0493B|nr:penicillin-binding protein [Bacillus mycoides]AIW84975.1 penicillin binding transpeptidase domain protein [Bacillus mycoides]EEL05894.1 Peptidoglycan glycosyltransferase [Bacillus cereus BDRD-ST196]GAE38180.1 putative penicillin-binding protein [Bacillus mycoides NBRC 101238 = DSM 11821]HDR7596192.1 penicillin-binding protein [Bacillus mycoides]